jgi:hypothetical protein
MPHCFAKLRAALCLLSAVRVTRAIEKQSRQAFSVREASYG